MSERIATWWMLLWDFINSQMIVRRALVVVSMWLTVEGFLWSKQFALQSKLDGAGIALIIGAVNGSAAILLKWVLDNYSENRK